MSLHFWRFYAIPVYSLYQVVVMQDVQSVIDFFFSGLLNFGNLWFSTFPISLAASVGVLALVYKIYRLLS